MATWNKVWLQTLKMFILCTFLCGVLYTGLITGAAQVLFPRQANGSLITINGKNKTYGSELMGQDYHDDSHMWGRIMKVDVSTYHDAKGNPLFYAGPSNLSPASDAYHQLIATRVEKLRAADPDMGQTPIPVDLVTGSGSGLDPAISPAAADYQVARIAKSRGLSEAAVRAMIAKCTTGRAFGIFGEPTVNVLKVNLMLDGILS